MSKTQKEAKQPKTYTAKQVTVALLPWMIILIAVVSLASVITGWNLRSQDTSRVTAEASTLIKTYSKAVEQK